MPDEFTEKFGDIKKLYELIDQAGIDMKILLAFLDPEDTFEDLTDEERDHLHYYMTSSRLALQENTPLGLNSHISLLDVDTATLSELYEVGIADIQSFIKRTDQEILEETNLTQSRIDELREQVKKRLVEQPPSIEDSFNRGN